MNRARRAAALAAALLVVACGPFRSEGTISLRPGMTRAEAERRSTMKLNQFGDSGRLFDFELAGEQVRFERCSQYMISDDGRGRIESFSFASVNETWPVLLRQMRETETALLRQGWKYGEGSPRVASLPRQGRKVRRTDSGAIDAFRFVKGDLELTVTPYAKWRSLSRKRYWRSMNVSPAAR